MARDKFLGGTVKINKSLASLSKAIRICAYSALGGVIIGFALMFGVRGPGEGSALTNALGGALIYLSAILAGLAASAAFLRLTAKAVIEGLDGNINTRLEPSRAEPSRGESNPEI